MSGLRAELRKIHPWMLQDIRRRILTPGRSRHGAPCHVFVCICDHFEPLWRGADEQTGLRRVSLWHEHYPNIAARHRDADGCHPRYTFFFPVEEYRPRYLELLAHVCHAGFGEVEIHLHHDRDTAARLRQTLLDFKQRLAEQHGLLAWEKATATIKYGFIHGNWALDNSRPDGRWCGVNNELQILRETGCYADFTLPSAPDPTQTIKINSIYYARGRPGRRKSHNRGIDAAAGVSDRDGLLLVQGPLLLNWRRRKFGTLPRIENSLLDADCRFHRERVPLWISAGIGVKNRPDCVFIKLHAHGCQDANSRALLTEDLDALYTELETHYNDGTHFILHYLSARELINVVKALEAAESGSPGTYREYMLAKFSDRNR